MRWVYDVCEAVETERQNKAVAIKKMPFAPQAERVRSHTWNKWFLDFIFHRSRRRMPHGQIRQRGEWLHTGNGTRKRAFAP